MSLFKRRGPSQEEIVRGNEVKRNITKELSVAIKTLQKEHLASQEPILSTDSANSVCSVLEAVFLHGVKDSVSKKIASYMSLHQSNDSISDSFNFWQCVLKFTHSDVVTQLKRLGQIYTEIGLCRAWVRMALNDGLMESYVVSMLADKKTLEYFYHRTAYLRDPEQPGILMSYLKGLMLLEFKLSYNSSVLNTWTHTPLSLAGIIDPHDTPLPVIHPSKEKPVSSKQTSPVSEDIHDGSEEVAVRTVRTRSRGESSSSGSDVTTGKKKVKEKTNKQTLKTNKRSSTSSNSNVYSADLTRNDVEEIRGKYAMGSSPQETHISECSTSSHISCPDPVKYNKNPSQLVETKETNDVIFNLSDDRMLDHDNAGLESNCTNDDLRASSAGKYKCDIQKDTLPDFIQHSMHLDATAEIEESEIQYSEKSKMPDITQNTTVNLVNGHAADEIKSISVISESGSESFNNGKTAEVPSDGVLIHEKISPSENGSYSDANDAVTVKSKSSKLKGKKHKLKPKLSPPNKTSVMPEVSNATADTVERTNLKLSKQRLSLPDIRLFQGHSSSPNLMDAISEPDTVKPRSESVSNIVDGEDGESDSNVIGNSLGARSGWSSSFDLEVTDVLEPLQSQSHDLGDDGIPIRRSKTESFGSMLKNYTPSSSIASPSLDDVLQDLPHSSVSSPMKSQYIPVQEIKENFTDEYEIVTNTMTSVICKDDVSG